MLLFILGLILFIGLVVVHEWGHFIMARRNGVEVEEFGIFFPPRLWKKRIRSPKGDFNFTINLLPLGGFVKMKGEHDSDEEPGTFGAASVWSKTKIMAAGVVMNLIVALVLLTGLAWVGTPVLICNQYTLSSDTHYLSKGTNKVSVTDVEGNSPASRIGIQKGDEILAAGPDAQDLQKVTPECSLSVITQRYAGQQLALKYRHDGQILVKNVGLRTAGEVTASANTKNPKGYLGLSTDTGLRFARSTWSAPLVAIGETVQFTKLTFQGLGTAVAGLGKIVAGAATGNSAARQHGQSQASSQVSGPVGIFVILKDGSALGYQFMLMIIAIISLTLAIMNILPIPALDGGRLWLTLITRALKRPLSPQREEIINAAGFVFLMGLIVLITVVDVRRFF